MYVNGAWYSEGRGGVKITKKGGQKWSIIFIFEGLIFSFLGWIFMKKSLF
jgi:hypothetical protein